MTALVWDAVGARRYETGVDRGVLYIPNSSTGVYDNGVAWNGLTTVTEAPSGAEATPQYADNIKYLNLVSAESFGATIEAFTYPDEFAQFDGTAAPAPGVAIGQQTRKSFGLAYRTRVGNDVSGTDLGYKIHLVYGALAAPTQKAYGTINDTPEAIAFSWDITTTPVAVTGFKPTAVLTIDSTKVQSGALATLETALYGATGVQPALPLPDAVITMFADTNVQVTPAAPTYNSGTHVVTIPTTTGITYKINGTNVSAGAQTAMSSGATSIVTAVATTGYEIASGATASWTFTY